MSYFGRGDSIRDFNISFALKDNEYDVYLYYDTGYNQFINLQIDSDLPHYQDKLSFVLEHCKIDYYCDDIDSLYKTIKEYIS